MEWHDFVLPGSILLAFVCVLLTTRWSIKERMLLGAAVVFAGYWMFAHGILLALPSTPVLKTFRFPDTPEDVATPEQVLRYLQAYDEAIVSLTVELKKMVWLSQNLAVGMVMAVVSWIWRSRKHSEGSSESVPAPG